MKLTKKQKWIAGGVAGVGLLWFLSSRSDAESPAAPLPGHPDDSGRKLTAGPVSQPTTRPHVKPVRQYVPYPKPGEGAYQCYKVIGGIACRKVK